MKKSKIYVNIPANAVAGGVESLFQLADAINNVGGESVVLWDFNYEYPVPLKYQHYNIKHSTEVEDSEDNLIIYPEVWTEKLGTYTKIKKAIWWLSVDNNHGKFKDFSNPNITHFYQSFYALSFLQKNNVEKYLPLFDYIPPSYTNSEFDILQKQNIICYNPVKGSDFTNQLKMFNPKLTFIPITGMSESEVIELLKLSKIYIDYGHHPGRDRIPRESAILGNIVLTNKKGSAGFYNDIPISEKFKTIDIDEISKTISECFLNFNSIINEYALYRSCIKNQKEQLYNLARQYFL